MENSKLESTAIPQAEEKTELISAEDTTPKAENEELFVPVKFNKEVRQLSLEEASTLAQKGLKFDAISQDFENLKRLAEKHGHSVSEFLLSLEKRQIDDRKKELLSQCGGNEEIADRIISLETGRKDWGFEELKEQFPQIKDISQLPQEIVENAKLKGTLLLDEYLRYLLYNEKNAEREKRNKKQLENKSLGPQQSGFNNNQSPETIEFLNGLWR
jgi:hypothetical protein